MLINIFFFFILLLIILYFGKEQINHIKGEGGCCGTSQKPPKKRLQGKILYKKIIHVEGMHCKNCENHATFALNSIDGVKTVKANAKKGEILIQLDREIEDSSLKDALKREDFTVKNIETV